METSILSEWASKTEESMTLEREVGEMSRRLRHLRQSDADITEIRVLKKAIIHRKAKLDGLLEDELQVGRKALMFIVRSRRSNS